MCSRRTARALIVMPFSRSRSIESRTWLVIWRGSMACVSSSRRSASVDLPWSMWAMIEKLRRRSCGIRAATDVRPGARRGRVIADGDHDDADDLEALEALAEEQEPADARRCAANCDDSTAATATPSLAATT